jgi:hypothetical protein
MEEIIIPQSVQEIHAFCFIFCKKLKTLRFESGSKLKQIGDSTMYSTAIESFCLPAGVSVLESLNCDRLRHIRLESGLMTLSRGAFCRSQLEWIDIPATVEEIGDSCFYECRSLTEVNFERDSRLKRIGEFAFAQTAIKTITIPRGVEVIPESCFRGCRFLMEVRFESELREIAESAFEGCPSQISIHINITQS